MWDESSSPPTPWDEVEPISSEVWVFQTCLHNKSHNLDVVVHNHEWDAPKRLHAVYYYYYNYNYSNACATGVAESMHVACTSSGET
jgi:hypothetical protein